MLSQGLDAVGRANELVRPAPGRCVRTSAVVELRHECDVCVQACPRDAIALEPLHVRLDACDGCRLCVEQCPTQALDDGALARGRMLDALAKIRPAAPFPIACGLARPADGNVGLAMVCLASVPSELVLAGLMLGAASVELRRGECRGCHLEERVGPALASVREIVARFGEHLDLGPVELVEAPLPSSGEVRTAEGTTQRDPVRDRALSRRGLFSALLERGRATAVEAALQAFQGLEQDLERVASGAEGAGVPWLRELLSGLLAKRDAARDELASEGFAARVVVSDELCTRCGVCIEACPTHALVRPETGAPLALFPHRCVACERCASSCVPRAVTLEPRINLAEWATREPLPLVAAAERECRVCGTPSVLPTMDVCAPCRREQLFRPT